MPTFQKILTAKHIEFPEYHKVYSIQELGNFIDYRRIIRDKDAHFRLECLMKELDQHGMQHPIIVSYNGYNMFWFFGYNIYTILRVLLWSSYYIRFEI